MRVIIAFCLLLVSVLAVNPGIQSTLTQNGFNFAKTIALQVLNQKVQNLNLPTESGVADVSILGKIDWDVYDGVLRSITFPISGIQVVPGQGLYVYVQGIAGSVIMRWHYRKADWPHISGSGQVTIDLASTSIEIHLGVSNSYGKPFLTAQSISVDIGHLSIHDSGGADWLYNLFIDVLKGDITRDIQNAVINLIKSEIDNNLNTVLMNLPVTQNLLNVAAVELGLSDSPIFGSGFMSFPELGEFILLPNSVSPFTAPPFQPVFSSSYMLEISFSPYVLDTASWAFFTAGYMQGTIKASQVPPSSPIQLNTSSWATFLPILYQKYPNYLMQVTLKADSVPTATFTTSGVTVTGTGEIDIDVVLPNQQVVPAFVLGVTLSAVGNAYANGSRIAAKLTYLSDSFSLKASYIGPFDPSNLETLLKFALSGVVIPYLNSYLANGFKLPLVDGVEIQDPVIGYYNGFVQLSTNLVYVG